uniref:Immunoglobulin V-set domain-containing protein n=1 Tax=Ornithorhynchus anatinus TaxID=9258 RepID=A0A6I8MZA8_ORNAN
KSPAVINCAQPSALTLSLASSPPCSSDILRCLLALPRHPRCHCAGPQAGCLSLHLHHVLTALGGPAPSPAWQSPACPLCASVCGLCFPDISAPREVSGLVGGGLTAVCLYEQISKERVKFWCRGASWGTCELIATTQMSWKNTGRVSISDHLNSNMFTVTMEKLTVRDADTYWCGIWTEVAALGIPMTVIVHLATTTQMMMTRTEPTTEARIPTSTQGSQSTLGGGTEG